MRDRCIEWDIGGRTVAKKTSKKKGAKKRKK
jgi:hypothetical protein